MKYAILLAGIVFSQTCVAAEKSPSPPIAAPSVSTPTAPPESIGTQPAFIESSTNSGRINSVTLSPGETKHISIRNTKDRAIIAPTLVYVQPQTGLDVAITIDKTGFNVTAPTNAKPVISSLQVTYWPKNLTREILVFIQGDVSDIEIVSP